MPKSKNFEKQIERIHKLIEGEGADVTWNDRMPDPDNPEQLRQIDVTIRYPDAFSIVECRIHSKPQDVKWIEELIGRRQSLRADVVIAVSASGFTSGAKKKAKKYGIILRDFNTLSEDEIKNWGKTTKVKIIYFEFTEIEIRFVSNLTEIGPEISVCDENGEEFHWRVIFEKIMNELDKKNIGRKKGRFKVTFDETPILFNGIKPTKVLVSGAVKKIEKSVKLASVVTYADHSSQSDDVVHIEKFDFGDFEIIQDVDAVAMVVDLSMIKIPEDSFFYTIMFDFGRAVLMKRVEFIGLQEAMDWHNKFSLGWRNY